MLDTPEKIIERWVQYVNQLDIDPILSLYQDRSTLLPTFSPHCMSKPETIKAYFLQLATRKNMRVEMHQETLRKAELNNHQFIMTGIYSFHFIVDEADLTFPSRFTFVLDVSQEKPIIHHHSSQIPRTLS